MKKLFLLLLCVPIIVFGQCVSGDCENGYGTYKFSGEWEGDICVGQWKDGLMHDACVNCRQMESNVWSSA